MAVNAVLPFACCKRRADIARLTIGLVRSVTASESREPTRPRPKQNVVSAGCCADGAIRSTNACRQTRVSRIARRTFRS